MVRTLMDGIEMTDEKHTPGPWYAADDDHCHIRRESDDAAIAQVFEDDGHCDPVHCLPLPSKANARLIAAAPELLEALKGLRESHPMRGENRSEAWERIAELFYNQTGILAPGKDQSAALCGTPTYEERQEAYREWLDARVDAAAAAIAKATEGGAS